MIPKEQKGPVMTTTGDLTEPGKADPAPVHSSDPILSGSQAIATQYAGTRPGQTGVSSRPACGICCLGWEVSRSIGRGLVLISGHTRAEVQCQRLGSGPTRVIPQPQVEL